MVEVNGRSVVGASFLAAIIARMIVGFARGILVVMNDGQILHSILYAVDK